MGQVPWWKRTWVRVAGGVFGGLLIAGVVMGDDDASPQSVETAAASAERPSTTAAEVIAPTTSTTSTSTTSTSTTTTTMPLAQITKEVDTEVTRACEEAVGSLGDAEPSWKAAWTPVISEDDLVVRAQQCVEDRWRALREAQERADAEERAREAAERERAAQEQAEREAREREQRTPVPAPAPSPTPAPGGGCDPNYRPCVPQVSYDLNCPDIGFMVEVIGSDPHRFDGDNDGWGCESYR